MQPNCPTLSCHARSTKQINKTHSLKSTNIAHMSTAKFCSHLPFLRFIYTYVGMAFCVSHPRLCLTLENIKMARTHCLLHRLTFRWSGSRARVRLPSLRHKAGVFDHGVENDQEVEFLSKATVEEELVSSEAGGGGSVSGSGGNRIVVVVDSTVEAKWALEWALSHAVLVEDTLVLLHVGKPKKGVSNGKQSARVKYLLQSMKNMCQKRSPWVRMELVMVDGKEKGPVIVEAAKQQKASLLVLGQRKSRMIWQLLKRWARKGGHGGDCSSSEVDYCIQNTSCMTIAVRRMSNELGGYLITTKHHRNFWLLA